MTDEELLKLAEKAAEHSYCKYSGFSVGAALLCEDGTVFTGCNVENGSFSLANCAERTAVFKAVSEGHRSFRKIAVVGSADGDFSKACFPCGACLQVLSEFCGGDFTFVLPDGAYTLDDLLPKRFEL